MKELDIGVNDLIICYCRGQIYGSTRAWWSLKTFGCKNVRILNGGFEQYKKEGYELERGEALKWKECKRKRSEADFKFEF